MLAAFAAEVSKAMEVSAGTAAATATRRNAPKYRPAPTFRYLSPVVMVVVFGLALSPAESPTPITRKIDARSRKMG